MRLQVLKISFLATKIDLYWEITFKKKAVSQLSVISLH